MEIHLQLEQEDLLVLAATHVNFMITGDKVLDNVTIIKIISLQDHIIVGKLLGVR